MGERKPLDLMYILSLPERSVRFIISGVTGISTLMTDLLFPEAFRKSSLYRVTFGMLQTFLVQKVAEVEQEKSEYEIKDKYLARKTAGSLIEGIGIVGIRFSPLWMLAIASDVAGGSMEYLEYLEKELKKSGLLAPEKTFSTLNELLDGIQQSSRYGIELVDLPPLSKNELIDVVEDIKRGIREIPLDNQAILHSLEEVWDRVLSLSQKKEVEVEKVNGLLAIDLMKNATRKGIDFSVASTQATLSIFQDHILGSYEETIKNINEVGVDKYLKKHMAPFVKQLNRHFKKDKPTVTERFLSRFGKKRKRTG